MSNTAGRTLTPEVESNFSLNSSGGLARWSVWPIRQ